MLAGVVIALAGLAAYANTFSVPFHFDDTPSILDNPPIQHLWPIGDVLAPRPDYGFTVSGRPVLNLSLAICHAVSGTNVWSYQFSPFTQAPALPPGRHGLPGATPCDELDQIPGMACQLRQRTDPPV